MIQALGNQCFFVYSKTASLALSPSKKQKKALPKKDLFEDRDSQIRTDDILLPKQTLYQTELHPVTGAKYNKA